jgi:protein phosphatase
MKKIPLHSLVIMVGPAGGGKTYWSNLKFAPYEVMSSEDIRYELTGDYQRLDANDTVFREIHRRTQLKLELGERVVVDATNLRKKDRLTLADIGTKVGVPIFYVVCNRDLDIKLSNSNRSWRAGASGAITKHEHIFRTNERDILRGDSIANVIDTRKDDFQVIPKLDNHDLKKAIEFRGFRGVMVVGDVHGMLEPLKNATEWASQRNLFCVFLGDVVDYGPNSLECVDHVYDVVTRGRGVCLIGNHERKIERWLEQVRFNDVRLRLSDGNKVTTAAIEALSSEARKKFENRYKALLGFSRHHWIIGDTLFTHGAAEPEMFDIRSARLNGRFETMALFGEVDNSAPPRADGYPTRIYEWVNRIPQGKRVMVGHDIRDTFKPLVVKGTGGGEAYFMDTGCGKGGRLTSADILFEGDNLVIKNFKSH